MSPTSQQPSDATHGAMSLEDALAALKSARAEAAENRRKAKELDDLHRKAEDDKLSETQKLQKQLAEAQAAAAAAQAQSQERMVRAEVRSVARELGLKPELAIKLIDQAAIVVDEATGDPTNIAELIASAIEQFGLSALVTPTSSAAPAQTPPAPAGQPQGQSAPQTPQAPQTGATNPPRSGQIAGSNGTFAADEIPGLTDRRLWRR